MSHTKQFSLNSKTSVAWMRELSGAAVEGFPFGGRIPPPVDLEASGIFSRLRDLETWGTEKEDARALIVEAMNMVDTLMEAGATNDAKCMVAALDVAFKYLKPHLP